MLSAPRLRILEAIEELNEHDPGLSLHVRIGINTGEAVVTLGARPEEGEGIVTGDVVNTASRLQGAAPVDGIAVSEQTFRQTERVFDYEALEPVALRGKAEPLPLWRPLQARARFGSELTRTHAAPLIGRDLEKSLLIGAFERSAQQRSCQLVTIVGEPGVGKSRLCAELFAHIDARPELVTWRQGRCLPYGEGIAFWALGEIVKAECGILESDSPDRGGGEARARRSPRTILTAPGSRRASPRSSARPRSPPRRTSRSRPGGASWSRWRSLARPCSCSRTSTGPTPPCSPSSNTWSTGRTGCRCSCSAPRAPSCTSSTRLSERTASATRTAINLAPLTDEETARLIAALLERAVLPAETQQALLERAGGNPLYAEEFVRLLTDRGQLEGVEEVPGSVQALITARLDTLPPERKSLLQDAAVVGKVFWAGALAEMGDREIGEVEQALHELVAQGARPSLTHFFDAGRGRVRLLAPAGQGRLLRADPTRRPVLPATARPPPGSSGRRASGPRTWPTCSPTTT